MVKGDDDKLDRILSLLEEIRAGLGFPEKVWLTPEEAAVYLGVSRSRVYQYLRSDRIPFCRLPDSNLVRLNRSDLDQWVRDGQKSERAITDETIRRLLK
jgi:excisionase family DNA binding protein